TALSPRATRPHGHHGGQSHPQEEALMQGAGRHPAPGGVSLTVCPAQGPGPGPRATRRSHRGVGATSSQGCPCPGAPIPAACGHTHFIHRRALPPRTQVGKKRGKRSRMPPTTHLPADDLDEDDAATPQATLLEKHPLAGEKQPSSSGQGPFFYIGGTNGASIISSYCKSKGWQRIQDARREDYQLKWCEVKSRDTYCSFREGEQLLFQLPNNKLLTTKIGLLSALRERARVVSKTSKVLKMEEFFPETYRLDIREEREAFFTLFDVHAEEEPPLRAVQGRHSVEHGAPQPLHQRQVLQDQGPPPRLGLHHLHGACTPARPQGRTPERAAGWGGASPRHILQGEPRALWKLAAWRRLR
uniref:Uncharacterized protein n=1 Tax=Sus scrofa TaxID=9823 RepID=A0A8D0I6A8_PIG